MSIIYYNDKGERYCGGWSKGNLKPHYAPVHKMIKAKRKFDGLDNICSDCLSIKNAKYNPTTNSNPKYNNTRIKASNRTKENKTSILKQLNHYIYYHYDGPNVVYIGRGSNDRAWQFNRQKDHLKWIISKVKINTPWVKIIKHNLTLSQAEWLEAIKINLYKPKYNIQIPSLTILRKSNEYYLSCWTHGKCLA